MRVLPGSAKNPVKKTCLPVFSCLMWVQFGERRSRIVNWTKYSYLQQHSSSRDKLTAQRTIFGWMLLDVNLFRDILSFVREFFVQYDQ